MAQPKGRRGNKPAGSRSDGSAAASAAGALWGGGAENTAFPEAAAEVKAGTLSSPGEGYDPRAATSARGVLTPTMQAAYTQGPFKDLNWLGNMTHQPDQAGAWKMGQAAADAASARALADNPQLLEQGNQAKLKFEHDQHVQQQAQWMADTYQRKQEWEAAHPGQIMPSLGWGDRMNFGSNVDAIGIPASQLRVANDTALLPGAANAAVLGQDATDSMNRLHATLNNQQNSVLTNPQYASDVLNSNLAHIRQPALTADASSIANAGALEALPWAGVHIVRGTGGDMFLKTPSAAGVLGEAVAGTAAQKNQPFQDATGKFGLRNVPAVPPSFSSGVRSADGGGAFVPTGDLGQRTLSPQLFGNYGLTAQPGGSPSEPPTGKAPLTEASDQGENLIDPYTEEKAPTGSWLEQYRKDQEAERQKIKLIPRWSIPLGF